MRKANARRGLAIAPGGPLLALLAALSVGAPVPASAQAASYRPVDRPKPAPRATAGPLLAVISLTKQRLWLHDATGVVAQSAVSTGRAGHVTPTGVFSVVQKKRFHRSNIYSAAPMPFMQRLTWSGIALHAGVVSGYPASHGCIRLPQQFAVELWGITRVGTRVVIVPDDASVRDIAHPRLPVPNLMPASRTQQYAEGETEQPAVHTTGIVEVANVQATTVLTPLERAKEARRRAVANADPTAKAAKSAVAISALRAAEANAAIAALRNAEIALEKARARRNSAAKSMDEAARIEAIRQARDLLLDAEARVAEAEKAADQARAVEATKTSETIAAAKAAWSAERASSVATAMLAATERNTEPISILVSRKAGRVFVRQAWASIHEAPVTFEDPKQPFGTHTYLAMAADEDGRLLRWISVSLPPSQPAPGRQHASPGTRPDAGHNSPARSTAYAPPDQSRPETAGSALERFDLSEDSKRFIADRLWPGATLIVTDEGMSPETGATTDFIVVTR